MRSSSYDSEGGVAQRLSQKLSQKLDTASGAVYQQKIDTVYSKPCELPDLARITQKFKLKSGHYLLYEIKIMGSPMLKKTVLILLK